MFEQRPQARASSLPSNRVTSATREQPAHAAMADPRVFVLECAK